MVDYLLGFSCLFPSIAITTIGSSTGIQSSIVISTIGVALHSYSKGWKFSAWFISAVCSVLLVFYFQLIFFTKNDLLFKNFFAFQACILCILMGMMLSRRPLSIKIFIRGYLAGCIFVSGFALIQILGWNVLEISSPLLLGFRNNPNFGDLSLIEQFDFASYGRAFGFASEPSILALLLIPGLLHSISEKRYKTSIFVGSALLATQSLSFIIILIPLFLYSAWRDGGQNLLSIYLKVVCIVLTIFFFTYMFVPMMSERLSNMLEDGSTISRLNSLSSGLEAVSVHPILGWGIQSDDLNYFIEENSTKFEINKSINSLLISIFAWFGIPLGALLLYPMFRLLCTRRVFCTPSTSTFLAATLIPALLSLNYFTLYNFWLCVGIASGLWLHGDGKMTSKILS